MVENKPVRIDKYLWAVRIYKTRSMASNECRKGRILVKDVPVKPSRTVSAGELILVRKPPVIHTFRVLETTENRVSAKIVSRFVEDLTSDAEKAKLDISHSGAKIYRERGTGRPTKKERRLIDKLQHDADES
jgi:ribosome-associated heat shock protein Hsp15